MSVFAATGSRVNTAFWATLQVFGLVLKVAGGLALLAGFLVVFEQVLDFMREDYWQSRSLFSAVPEPVLNWLITTTSPTGYAKDLMRILSRIPLSAAMFIVGTCTLIVGVMFTRNE